MLSSIQFNFALEKGRLEVLLEADIHAEDQGTCYLVTDFRIRGHAAADVLPQIRIEKKDGRWVHCDSGWRSDLSEAAGKAIDMAMERLHVPEPGR